MRCAHCRAESPPEARFCASCGAALRSSCRHCGESLLAGQRFCPACGMAAGPPAASADDAERRQATVVFSDLSGYTALNEALDPEDVEALLGRIKAAASGIVERHGGTINQFVGDEVMALYGVPVARRDDARRAVTATLALHRAVAEIVSTLAADAGRSLELHSGINTGLVVARRGGGRAGDFALTGDAVNTAARLRSLAGPGEIVVSAATWREVQDFFDADAGSTVELKGKGRPLVVHRVRGERAPTERPASELVGRDEELRELDGWAAACARRGRGRVVVVRGDPGVGKSRLVAEFAGRARDAGFACHAVAVLDFGAQTGRDALRTLARSLLDVAVGDEPARRQAIERFAASRGVAPEGRVFLHDLLDVAAPPELRTLAAAMSIDAREQGSLRALCELVAAVGADAPLLLLVEDIHWADAWTLERLAALAGLAARRKVLLVATTRFAGDPTAGTWRIALHGAPVVGVDLAPLAEADALRLAGRASTMPAAVLASCVERAEGNPLFLLQLLLDAGETARADLPGSIQALVHARMDRLAAADKSALQAAAVLGQRCSPEALGHLLDDASYDARVLVDQFLVRRDAGELVFCHALIRDGAYATLLLKRRRALHVRAAEWFEPRDLVLAAEHFERAQDARAAPTYLRAGESLVAQLQVPAALAVVERGSAIAADRATRFELLLARARLLLELGRPADAIEAGEASLQAAADGGERARGLIAVAAGMRLTDRIDDGLAALAEAQSLAVEASLPLELSRLHHLRGNLLFPLARTAECLEEHEAARRHARAAGSVEAEAAALGGLGDAYYLQGRMRSANERFRACVELARAHGFGRLEVANLPMAGITEYHVARIGEAARAAKEALELSRRAAQPRAQVIALTIVLWVEGLIRGDRDVAERHIEAALDVIARLGAHRFEAQVRACAAVLAARAGERVRAEEQARAALEICRRHGMAYIGAFVLGACALAEVDPSTRLARLDEAEAVLLQGGVSHNHLWMREIAIEALLDIGAWEAVEGTCARLREYTAAEPLPYWDGVAARGLALARHGRGERSPALRSSLVRLRDEARAGDLQVAVRQLDRVLAAAA